MYTRILCLCFLGLCVLVEQRRVPDDEDEHMWNGGDMTVYATQINYAKAVMFIMMYVRERSRYRYSIVC